jgi:DNA repair exonuclease SbcCD ATPase subunit
MNRHLDTPCNQCKEILRKETLLTHIIKNHPTFFWNDIFTLARCEETGALEIQDKCKMQMREAYGVLDNDAPYELEDELFVDFGSKQTFKNSATALKHIQKHTEKHKENYVEMLKEGLNVDTVKQLLSFMRQRKVKFINDQNEVDRQVEKQVAEEKKKIIGELNMAIIERDKCRQFMERDEVKELERMREELYQSKKELRDANNVMRHQDAELFGFRTSYANLESINKTNMTDEMTQLSYYEKAKANCEAKMKKHEEECDKKIKKAKEEIMELTNKYEKKLEEEKEKFEKKEKKLKAEVKAYKQEIQLVKLRAKQSDSDSD